jgi:hypothetical protein
MTVPGMPEQDRMFLDEVEEMYRIKKGVLLEKDA